MIKLDLFGLMGKIKKNNLMYRVMINRYELVE